MIKEIFRLFSLVVFCACTSNSKDTSQIAPNLKLRESFINYLEKLESQGDSTFCLTNVYSNSQYDTLYLFTGYTPVEIIEDSMRSKWNGIFEDEVKEGSELFVFKKDSIAVDYFVIRSSELDLGRLKRTKFPVNISCFVVNKKINEGQKERKILLSWSKM